MNIDSFVCSIITERYGWHQAGELLAHFSRRRLVYATPAVEMAYALRMAHLDQIGF